MTRITVSRREWLAVVGGAMVPWQDRGVSSIERRIAELVRQFEQQGDHRTGTGVDRRSGEWLAEQVERRGLKPALESFSFDRVDPITASIIVGDRRIEGLPLFDGAFTDAGGVSGRLGVLDSDADIGLVEAAPNTAAAGPIGDARTQHRHSAIVCVTRGLRPGLCPNNADQFLHPFGPPVLQVPSDVGPWFRERAAERVSARLIGQVKRTRATAVNVTAKISGADSSRPALVVMTPRSGWYSCASERGGGIACWLELMGALQAPRPERDILFVASSGHELGHLGLDAFVDARPGIVSKSRAWMHFGANIGAAVDPGTIVQASDDDAEAVLAGGLAAAGLRIDRRNPRGTVPNGEAELVHRGGGRYVSVIGRSALFHNVDDRGPQAINPSAIARFVAAFSDVARALAK